MKPETSGTNSTTLHQDLPEHNLLFSWTFQKHPTTRAAETQLDSSGLETWQDSRMVAFYCHIVITFDLFIAEAGNFAMACYGRVCWDSGVTICHDSTAQNKLDMMQLLPSGNLT